MEAHQREMGGTRDSIRKSRCLRQMITESPARAWGEATDAQRHLVEVSVPRSEGTQPRMFVHAGNDSQT